MKKEELPQDRSALEVLTPEVCYIKNEEGKYDTALSSGWDIKADALDNAWDDIKQQIDEAKAEVLAGNKSPLYYYMMKDLMDTKVLAGYAGISSLLVKLHLKPSFFQKLSLKTLQKYADVFKISVDDLQHFKG